MYVKENLVEILLTSLIRPLLYLLAFGFDLAGNMSQWNDSYLAFIISGIISFTTLSATFSTMSMKILIQRLFYMSFDELLLCPIYISLIILGKAFQDVIRALLSYIVIMVIGHLISIDVVLLVFAIAMVLVAGLIFSVFGILVEMLLNKSQTLTLFSNLTIVPMTFLCGTLFDIEALPSAAAAVVYLFPLIHVSEIMREVMLDTSVPRAPS